MRKEERFWDFVSGFHDSVAKDEIQKKTIEIAKNYLGPDDIVLDYGCATGLYSVEFAKVAKEVDGIDISKKMIELAQANALSNTKFSKTTIFDIDKPGYYNAILAFNVLHFIKEEERVMSKISELLKPGGIFISVTPCLGENKSALGLLAIIFSKIKILPFLKSYRFEELDSLVSSNFEIFETIDFSKHQYMIVARKI